MRLFGLGNWFRVILARSLLSKVVLPGAGKNAHLKRLENATENLQLFKADLLDYDSLRAAIDGCEGVFHTACPVLPGKVADPENVMVSPAVNGTLNVLKACSEANVRRVVVVSSTAAVTMNPAWPHDKIMDENCWSDKEHCKTTENWYCFSKTISEEKALNYAKEGGLDVVTVCPCVVLGPMLQPTVNASSFELVEILKGLPDSIENKVLQLVDVRDVADALLLAYEKPEATGRYICCSHLIKPRDFIDKLRSMYPKFKYCTNFTEVELDHKLCSEKLKQLGWKYRTLEETITDTIEHFLKKTVASHKACEIIILQVLVLTNKNECRRAEYMNRS